MHDRPKYADGFDHLAYANPDALQSGTLRLGVSGSFDSVNPFGLRGTRAAGLDLISQALLARSWDEPFSLYGLIADRLRVADDRSWIEFHLRDGVRWSDGSPLTTDDVLFSWQTLKEKGRPTHRTYYSKVAMAEVVAPATIRFTFTPTNGVPDREMPLIMGLMPLLQKAWWQGRDIAAPMTESFPTAAPYIIGNLTSGRKITYIRNPNYWGKDLPINKGQWNFDAISYDYYRDDDVALEAFKSGAFDVRREPDPLLWENGYDGPSFDRGDTLKRPMAHQRPEPLRGFIFNTRRAVFSSPAVRQAIAVTFDFDWINRTLYAGNYKRIDSLFPNSELSAHAAPDNSTAPMRTRIKQAFELLEADGWRMQKGQMMKNGAPLSFEILLVDARDEKIALTLVRGLKKLGITARVRTVDSAQYQARLTDFDYDMILNFWSSTLSPGNEQMAYWGSAAADQPGSRNYAGIKSPEVDSLIHALMETTTRQGLISAAQALDRAVLSQHIVIPMGYLGKDLVATRKGLTFPDVIPVYGALPEQTAWWATVKDHQE